MNETAKTNGALLALGTFDGLHTGHKRVLTAGSADDGARVALLFREHPLKVLTGDAPGELLTASARDALLQKWGVTPVFCDFADLRDETPRQFFENEILGRCHATAVSCGFNYRFGKAAAGDVTLLRELCAAHGLALHVAEPVLYGGAPVSSTRIREALRAGDLPDVTAMLGRYFCYAFPVVHGDERGRLLGSPTLNQFFARGFQVPRFGVYASFTYLDGKRYPSVTNVGVRPTVGAGGVRSETNVLGYDGDLYGRTVPVALVAYVRGERRFASFDELSVQIAADREAALQILEKETDYELYPFH